MLLYREESADVITALVCNCCLISVKTSISLATDKIRFFNHFPHVNVIIFRDRTDFFQLAFEIITGAFAEVIFQALFKLAYY